MSDEERVRWDERYRAGSYSERRHPTQLLADRVPQLAPGRALDVACGTGRNSHFLAAAGWQVDAIDISPAGLARARGTAEALGGLGIRWIQGDLDDPAGAALPAGPYDLIVLVRYVNHELFPHLMTRLAPGGILLCEQHVETTEEVIGPRSKGFRFRHNELLRDVTNAAGTADRLLYYREGLVTDPDGRRAALAQLVLEAGPDD